MGHEIQTGSDHPQTPRIGLAYIILAATAVLFLLIDHWAHVFGILPYLLLLACPLFHLFMHRGHGGHKGGKDEAGRHDAPR